MDKQLFRKKSIERISSPEQLGDYIRVANPGVWMVLAFIALLLVGVVVWGFLGRMDTVLKAGAITREEGTRCYIKEADRPSVTLQTPVRIDGTPYAIREIALLPVQVDDTFPDYLVHVGSLTEGEWVYALMLEGVHGEEGGIYTADVIVESVVPLSYVLN